MDKKPETEGRKESFDPQKLMQEGGTAVTETTPSVASLNRKMYRNIHVEICRARNLAAKDGSGSADPYCTIEASGEQKMTTVKEREVNPVWNEQFVFRVPHVDGKPPMMPVVEKEILEICVYSKSNSKLKSGSSFLGRLKLPINLYGETPGVVLKGKEREEWRPLEKRGIFSHVQGEICFKIFYTEGEGFEDEPPRLPTSPNTALEVEPQTKRTSRPLALLAGSRSARSSSTEEHKSAYLYVRVDSAKALRVADQADGTSDPFVKLKLGKLSGTTKVILKDLNPKWNQVFAFENVKRTESDGSVTQDFNSETDSLEVTVWDQDYVTHDFLGAVAIPLSKLPTRSPADDPLPPQSYRLGKSNSSGGKSRHPIKGEICISAWFGSPDDRAYNEVFQPGKTGGVISTFTNVYWLPQLFYIRISVLKANNLVPPDSKRIPEVFVKVKLGSLQKVQTRVYKRSFEPEWNEDLLLIGSHPLDDALELDVFDRVNVSTEEFLGHARIPLSDIPERLDDTEALSRSYVLDKGEKRFARSVTGRIVLRMCIEGGYHVISESPSYPSCSQPSAKSLHKPLIGQLELGIISAKLIDVPKSTVSRSAPDVYCLARYGNKWVRTRNVSDLNPAWNENYIWDVSDVATFLTIGVYDNRASKAMSSNRKEALGKVRIRLSTLKRDETYRSVLPLFAPAGAGYRRMGDLELSVRLVFAVSPATVLKMYFQPALPAMHYYRPIPASALPALINTGMKLVASRLARGSPALRDEVVYHMLDSDEQKFTFRRMKANAFRIQAFFQGDSLGPLKKFMDEVRSWRNLPLTLGTHSAYVFVLYYMKFCVISSLIFCLFSVLLRYRFRTGVLPPMDSKLSVVEDTMPDDEDIEEEVDSDTAPEQELAVLQNPYKNYKILKSRYELLLDYALLIQSWLGTIASIFEKFSAIMTWQDPRGTFLFLIQLTVLILLMYYLSIKLLLTAAGFYFIRHPRLRNPLPPPPVNLMTKFPSLADRML
ncbi:hypothetical protein CBR_g72638 [Chara braunii]|uniref:C2 domain-containing protein n=1 Tax=Chara braunii TaxID=69332 RepID=A0A388KAB1_CHABU|nr:hypothetical protein CBR_g72638 [Chara braunii]|eukprot:GBG66883.1 hypothetical protein CBR_g72638 [Chara braunii]